MIQLTTYIGVLLSFFITVVLSERYYKNHQPQISLKKLILIIMLLFFILLTIVVIIPEALKVLIYGSVALASYFNVYNRHRKIPGEV